MQTTTHYGLQKPDPNDTYNKAYDNTNMDKIDAQMWANQVVSANYDVAATSVDGNGKYTVTTYTRPADGTKYMVSTLSGTMDANGNYPTMTNVFYKADGTTVDHTDTWTLTWDASSVLTNRTVVTS